MFQKRHWVGTMLEIVVPTVLFMALVALRTEGKLHCTVLYCTVLFRTLLSVLYAILTAAR